METTKTVERIHPVAATDHPMVHLMAAAAVETAVAAVDHPICPMAAVAEEIQICTKELMQRN